MCIDRYPFKRDAFFELGEKLSDNHIVFIIGPRKTGKTVCMKQIEDNYKTEQYYDFKKNTEEDILDKIDEVCDSIRNNRDTIYLLDEFSHTDYPDIKLERIAEAYTDNPNSKTKIVVSSSQSLSLQYWANRSFCGNVGFVEVDFLKYHEWLRKTQTNVISDETYRDYILGVKSFYGFKSLTDYLQGCLDETATSNFNVAQTISQNDINGLTVDMLLDVLYATMFLIQHQSSYDTMFDIEQLKKTIRNYYKDEFKIQKEITLVKIEEILIGRYMNFFNMSRNEYIKSILFLYNCGLITILYESPNKIDRDIINDFKTGTIIDVENNNIISSKNQINRNINITLNYPMFYAEIVKEILGDEFKSLNNSILGELVECHIKGMLPSNHAFQFRDDKGKEIDYINNSNMYALEVSISNKSNSKVHFDMLDSINCKNYKKILTTNTYASYQNDIIRIPYYDFIGLLSINKSIGEICYIVKEFGSSRISGNNSYDEGLSLDLENLKAFQTHINDYFIEYEDNIKSKQTTKITLENKFELETKEESEENRKINPGDD